MWCYKKNNEAEHQFVLNWQHKSDIIVISKWTFIYLPARASEQGNVIGSVRIGECGSTLYVGLSRIVRNLIQKSIV